jgi:polar amino acid transport system permease protein
MLPQELTNYIPVIFSGLINTFVLTLGGIILGFAIGVAMAFAEIFLPRPLASAVSSMGQLIRGIPLLVILFMIFYGFPRLGLPLPPTPSAILGIGLRSGAYQSQLFRGAIEAVGYSQLEAALSLGMTKGDAFKNIILPQALRIVVPGWVNEFTIVLKDTSIAYAIGVTEIFTQAVHVAQVTLDYLPPLLIVAAVYFTICFTVSTIANRLYIRYRIPGLGGVST